MAAMIISEATDPQEWDAFLADQPVSPFLQSWTMGEVYKDVGQQPIRLIMKNGETIEGICMALFVPARRGRHVSVPYGPVLRCAGTQNFAFLHNALIEQARIHHCAFIRISPHWNQDQTGILESVGCRRSPLHLLAEHIWYLPLSTNNPWQTYKKHGGDMRKADDIFKEMRSTTRNLIRRAEKDGVTIEKSEDPLKDLPYFITLHEETRKRHGFTPYTNKFFETQVKHFATRNECTLYLAKYQNEVISASIHMHAFGETSYHHGASTFKHRKIPSSYLLQWTAIKDAIERGDHIYNFWGIAEPNDKGEAEDKAHPFAGVTLFKTGFGGQLLSLVHCMDLPLTPMYQLTRMIEILRKWKRGF